MFLSRNPQNMRTPILKFLQKRKTQSQIIKALKYTSRVKLHIRLNFSKLNISPKLNILYHGYFISNKKIKIKQTVL